MAQIWRFAPQQAQATPQKMENMDMSLNMSQMDFIR